MNLLRSDQRIISNVRFGQKQLMKRSEKLHRLGSLHGNGKVGKATEKVCAYPRYPIERLN